jgi:hypothetical protein
MSIRKENATRGEPVQVRGDGLAVTAHATDPVIQIIHRDEKDVGFFGFYFGGTKDREEENNGKYRSHDCCD